MLLTKRTMNKSKVFILKNLSKDDAKVFQDELYQYARNFAGVFNTHKVIPATVIEKLTKKAVDDALVENPLGTGMLGKVIEKKVEEFLKDEYIRRKGDKRPIEWKGKTGRKERKALDAIVVRLQALQGLNPEAYLAMTRELRAKLTPRQYEIVTLILTNPSIRYVQIGKVIGKTVGLITKEVRRSRTILEKILKEHSEWGV